MGKETKQYASKDDIITIRKFLRKYVNGPGYKGRLTHQKFDKIMRSKGLMPMVRVATSSVTAEDIANGKVLWVVDEAQHPAGYLNPYYKEESYLMSYAEENAISDKEKEAIRRKNLKEQGYMIDFDGQTISIDEYEQRQREDDLLQKMENFFAKNDVQSKQTVYVKKYLYQRNK